MQKREKSGRFAKGKVKKKLSKKAIMNPKAKIQKIAKKGLIKDISDLTFFDLQDMISAEVALQMRY
jgi:hypothetical protein